MDVRENILHREKEFRHATAHLLPEFELVGEAYKRPLLPDQPEAVATWYNRKSFSVMKENHDIAELFNPQLTATLAETFTQLAPLYTFLIRVEEEKNSDAEQQRTRLFG